MLNILQPSILRGPHISDALWNTHVGDIEDGQCGALLIWDNPSAAEIAAGENAALRVFVGGTPTFATPAAGDVVAVTIATIQEHSNPVLWAQNIVIGTDVGGGVNPFLLGSEINIYSNYELVEEDPWGSGSDRKQALGLTTTGPENITVALANYCQATDGTNWFVTGGAFTRCRDVGWRFEADPGGDVDAVDAFAVAAIWDNSNSATILKDAVGRTHIDGIDLSNSTYTGAQFKGTGFEIDPAGNITADAMTVEGVGVLRMNRKSGANAAGFHVLLDDVLRTFFVTDGASYGQMLNVGNYPFFIGANNQASFQVSPGGNVGVNLGYLQALTATLDVNGDSIRLRGESTPTSPTAAGNPGEIRRDADRIYICCAQDQWGHIPINTGSWN